MWSPGAEKTKKTLLFCNKLCTEFNGSKIHKVRHNGQSFCVQLIYFIHAFNVLFSVLEWISAPTFWPICALCKDVSTECSGGIVRLNPGILCWKILKFY